MKKIPTVFERDWNGDRSRVVDQVNPGCEWVLAGEGIPTRKVDGTCCLMRGGKLFKRQEVKPGKPFPPDFEEVGFDDTTGKRVGWCPVGDGPEDRYHREGFDPSLPDGTYELVGPKVQGNVEHEASHRLVPHTTAALAFHEDVPRTFAGIQEWMLGRDIEGVVFHHPDGRMAKIKLRDFGIKRG